MSFSKQITSLTGGISGIIKATTDSNKLGAVAIIGIILICISWIYGGEIGSSFRSIVLPLVSILFISFIGMSLKMQATGAKGKTRVLSTFKPHAKQEESEAINLSAKFDIPSMLILQRYGPVDPDGFSPYRSLKIYTIRSLTTEDFVFEAHRHSFGEIKKDESISDQVDTEVRGIGTHSSITKKSYTNNYQGKHYINISEAEWKEKIGVRPDFFPGNFFHKVLYEKVLLEKNHDCMGTVLVADTERIRQLIYFPSPKYVPEKFKSIEILADGEIKEPEEVRIEIVKKESLVIVEADKLSAGSGFYTYWRWSDDILA